MSNIKYQKLDPIQHIHHRPDMYVGDIRVIDHPTEWVLSDNKIEKKDVKYSDGLIRIFVEAISNAIDNVWRSKNTETPCTKIKVTISEDSVSVWNDGLAITIEQNEFSNDNGKKTKIYNPELIFGHLLSGSNYDDTEERFTSGRNGLGIKLTNVFSNEFEIDVYDPVNMKRFRKRWYNNMRESDKYRLSSSSKQKPGYTNVTWKPDFEKFNLTCHTPDILMVMHKIVYDCAMVSGVAVFLNDKKVKIKNITEYAKLYKTGDCQDFVKFSSDQCDVVFMPGNGEHISFTNGIFNKDGGVHVEKWTSDILKSLLSLINKPNKPTLSMRDIRKFFRIFVKCEVPNPEFSSQSKTYLTSPPIKTNIDKKQIKSIMKWNVVSEIHDIIKSKELLALKKTEKKSKSFRKIVGYDPANMTGSKKSNECSLILCEGLSAKTFAVEGIAVGCDGKKGRDWFGIYPLRGKLLNVRNASLKSIAGNKEISDVIHAIGLQYGVDYTDDNNFNKLNYGKCMILTDSDVDGIHICSLIINMFHHLFPSILKRETSFIVNMNTPIVKVIMNRTQYLFYSESTFEQFYNKNKDNNKMTIKYYKGLGTSSNKEIHETFGKKLTNFEYDDTTDYYVDTIFNNKQSSERKQWLVNKTLTTPCGNKGTYSHYINTELIRFSLDDCNRSIPCIFDGLKQSHRKILYACFKKKLSYGGKSMKVAQLAGYVAEHTKYHHGEQCLFDTITKLAQDFPGSNNIPLLYPDGQFGTRLNGGKDAANARYIFTKLSKFARILYPDIDDKVLDYRLEDGESVEPTYYCPIIPMILVNGCSAGIGTGWSCSIPSYNPIDIINNVKNWLNDKDYVDMVPWYKGYKGKIEKIDEHKFVSYGKIEKNNNTTEVTELPVMMWTDKFKEYVEDLLERKLVKKVKNYSTPDKIKFVINDTGDLNCTIDTLHLKTPISETNMVLFDNNNNLHKYNDVSEILSTFCIERLELYKKRKMYLINQLQVTCNELENKYRFVKSVVDKQIELQDKTDDELISMLQESNYLLVEDSYNYLLNISIRRFTKKNCESMQEQITKYKNELNDVMEKSEKDTWLEELDNLVKILH